MAFHDIIKEMLRYFRLKDRPSGEAIVPHLLCWQGIRSSYYTFILAAHAKGVASLHFIPLTAGLRYTGLITDPGPCLEIKMYR